MSNTISTFVCRPFHQLLQTRQYIARERVRFDPNVHDLLCLFLSGLRKKKDRVRTETDLAQEDNMLQDTQPIR